MLLLLLSRDATVPDYVRTCSFGCSRSGNETRHDQVSLLCIPVPFVSPCPHTSFFCHITRYAKYRNVELTYGICHVGVLTVV